MSVQEVIYISDSELTSEEDVVCTTTTIGPLKITGHCRECRSNVIQIACYPCMHASYCESCYRKLATDGKCPYCGTPVKSAIRFYLA